GRPPGLRHRPARLVRHAHPRRPGEAGGGAALPPVRRRGTAHRTAHRGGAGGVPGSAAQDPERRAALRYSGGRRGDSAVLSLAIPRDTVLFTVPTLMPSLLAISGSVMSS